MKAISPTLKPKDNKVNKIQLAIRSAAWLSIAIVLLVTVVPIGPRPSTGFSADTERFCAMAVVGVLFSAAYPKRFWLVVLALPLATALFEPLQFIAVGRHPAFRDAEFKSLGAVIGGLAGYAVAFTAGQINSRLSRAP